MSERVNKRWSGAYGFERHDELVSGVELVCYGKDGQVSFAQLAVRQAGVPTRMVGLSPSALDALVRVWMRYRREQFTGPAEPVPSLGTPEDESREGC